MNSSHSDAPRPLLGNSTGSVRNGCWQLADSSCLKGARGIVEKPFGHDLASAKELNKVLLRFFDEADIFRIDYYLGKRAVNNVLALRFAYSGVACRR